MDGPPRVGWWWSFGEIWIHVESDDWARRCENQRGRVRTPQGRLYITLIFSFPDDKTFCRDQRHISLRIKTDGSFIAYQCGIAGEVQLQGRINVRTTVPRSCSDPTGSFAPLLLLKQSFLKGANVWYKEHVHGNWMVEHWAFLQMGKIRVNSFQRSYRKGTRIVGFKEQQTNQCICTCGSGTITWRLECFLPGCYGLFTQGTSRMHSDFPPTRENKSNGQDYCALGEPTALQRRCEIEYSLALSTGGRLSFR